MHTRAPNSNDVTTALVEVLPYEASWPRMFEAERTLLERVLAQWLCGPIEHIGSTAVPGLMAKPVIDIMAPVRDLNASRPAVAALVSAEYAYFPYKSDVMHWFCKPSPGMRTHHLHLVPFNSLLWRQRLTFRDALRRSPSLATEYAKLKLRLAQRYPFEREAYTEAKSPFVTRVLGTKSATDAGAP